MEYCKGAKSVIKAFRGSRSDHMKRFYRNGTEINYYSFALGFPGVLSRERKSITRRPERDKEKMDEKMKSHLIASQSWLLEVSLSS